MANRDDKQVVEITVRIWMDEDADPQEVVSEMNYQFTFEGVELETEIVDINTEL